MWRRCSFPTGPPVSAERLAQALDADPAAVRAALEELEKRHSAPASGLRLARVAGGYQLTTRTEWRDAIERLIAPRRERALTEPALEALSVIAYRQPVTLPELNEIRGVGSQSVVATLVKHRLVRTAGRNRLSDAPSSTGPRRSSWSGSSSTGWRISPSCESSRRPYRRAPRRRRMRAGRALPTRAERTKLPPTWALRTRRVLTWRPSRVRDCRMAAERLQKLIAAAGIASRRRAEELIAAGRVTVDGEVVRTPGVRADPAHSDVRVDGARLHGLAKPRRYVILNKPIGHLATRSDPARRPTVMDLLPHSFRALAPVGRLDGNSSGLMLFTDDGDLALHVAHPRYRVPKTYYATVRGLPEEGVLERARRGVRVDGEPLRLDQVEVMARFPHRAEAKRRTRLRVTLRGGRNREIRRVLSVLGHPVLELHRTRIGCVADTGLAPGKWRKLRAREVDELRELIGRSSGETAKPPAGDGAAAPPDDAGTTPVDVAPGAFVVAIDGPAGSGKTSVARAVAERFGFGYFNTGASVRAVALAAMRASMDLDDGPSLRVLAYRVILDPEGRVFLDGEDVTSAVRAPRGLRRRVPGGRPPRTARGAGRALAAVRGGGRGR